VSQLQSNVPPPHRDPLPREVAVGELRLLRGWYLTTDQSLFDETMETLRAALRSSYVDYLWTPDVNEAAHFDSRAGNGYRRKHPRDVAPLEGCGCGIYGVFDPESVQGGDIVGVVEYWGKVRMGNLGIRAQFARVVELAPGVNAGYRYAYLTERAKRARLTSIGQRYDAKVHFSQRDLLMTNAGKLTRPDEFGIRGIRDLNFG
jgi:hypothetical protein